MQDAFLALGAIVCLSSSFAFVLSLWVEDAARIGAPQRSAELTA